MKKLGIIGAMDLEVEMISKEMNIDKEVQIAGNTYYEGTLHGREIVVSCCGCGKVNAASSAQILISEFKVDGLINTGIAGGMKTDVEVCDIVISTDVTHHDVRKRQMVELFPFVGQFDSNKRLIDLAVETAKIDSVLHGKWHVGRIVSGEAFINDKDVKNRIIKEYEPYCVEMEGSAIGHVAHINQIPFLVIRSISDNADDEANMSYEKFERIAAEQSSNLVMEMIKRL